ncbi:MAG: hypothetical protein K0Q65_2015 [Clostridia bacterium]|nr:hypothetical protein [Clostridia bacterium]
MASLAVALSLSKDLRFFTAFRMTGPASLTNNVKIILQALISMANMV